MDGKRHGEHERKVVMQKERKGEKKRLKTVIKLEQNWTKKGQKCTKNGQNLCKTWIKFIEVIPAEISLLRST